MLLSDWRVKNEEVRAAEILDDIPNNFVVDFHTTTSGRRLCDYYR